MSASDIIDGLHSALAVARGEQSARVKHIKIPEHVDIQGLRKSLRLTQAEFAQRFRFQLSAVRNWEQGRRVPSPSTILLLKVIEEEADMVARILEDVPDTVEERADILEA